MCYFYNTIVTWLAKMDQVGTKKLLFSNFVEPYHMKHFSLNAEFIKSLCN